MHFSDFTFNLINGLANHSKILDTIMIVLSKSIPYILMISTVTIYLVGITKKDSNFRSTAVSTIIKTAISYILSQIIGSFFPFSRPFVNNPNANLLYHHEANASFPSDHSLGSMSLALGTNRLKILLSKINVVLAFIVGFSRVYVGHHYPLDVLGGFLIAFIVGKLYDKYLYSMIDKLYFYVEKYVPILNKMVE